MSEVRAGPVGERGSVSTTVKPRLLFLSQTLPYPPHGGVKIRTYNILRLLARSFDITALCFYRWKRGVLQQDVSGSVAALEEYAAVQAFPIPQEHSRVRLLWDHARSTVKRRAYTVYVYESLAFRAALEEVLSTTSFDVVHSDSLDLSGYFPLLSGLPIVCTHHDAQSTLLRRRAAAETSRWRRAYVRHQGDLTQREEAYWCEKVAQNVTVSAIDASVLSTIAPRGRFAVIPNGVDTEFFRPEVGSDEGVVCVGGTTWFPNRDALEYFAGRILPRLRDSGQQASVRWVGRAREEEQRRYREDYGIELTGYVPDVRPYIRDAACYIVPIRVGGGTRIKILDAWAMGKAVVSTSVGCEGLEAVDEENILIRDEPSAFAAAVRDVLRRPDLRESLGAAARRTAERTYSWEVIEKNLSEVYGDVSRSRS
jgi:polysaccharide biosynthesis protein PslH